MIFFLLLFFRGGGLIREKKEKEKIKVMIKIYIILFKVLELISWFGFGFRCLWLIGAAGSVIAGRLATADPLLKILVIEAGMNNLNHSKVIAPAMFLSHLSADSETAYFHLGRPSHHLNGRTPIVPGGKILGGGSSIKSVILQIFCFQWILLCLFCFFFEEKKKERCVEMWSRI